MMRLHQMHIRMAPVLRGAVAGPASPSIAHVVPSSVGVSSVVVPVGDRSRINLHLQ